MRLNRYLASAGLGSRRSCEQLVLDGRVTINGDLCTSLATRVSGSDAVKVNNKLIAPVNRYYVLLNKPKGLLCTRSDEHGRRTIYDLMPDGWPPLSHVGRLDKESEGLIILTNDGDLAQRLTHPKYKVEKEYEVTIDREYSSEDTVRLLKGVFIEGGWAKAQEVHVLSPKKIKMILMQGIKRQIRLMMRAVGYKVVKLRRVRIGSIHIKGLAPGHWRELTPQELRKLRSK